MRIDRSRIAVALAAVLVAGGGGWLPTHGAAAQGAQCGSTQVALGKWSATDPPAMPEFTDLPATIVAATVVGQDPSVVLATDGAAVYRSTDGGCHWRTAYTLGPTDYPTDGGYVAAYAITEIATGHSAAPASRQDVYLSLTQTPLNIAAVVAAGLPTLIVASHDGGQTFATAQPAPTSANPIVPTCQGVPDLVTVPPTDSRTIYLRCTGGIAHDAAMQALVGNAPWFVYRSRDGGQSWSVVPLPTYQQYGVQWFQFGLKPDELWVAGQWIQPNSNDVQYVAVWHSTDGGSHWSMATPYGKPGSSATANIGVAVDPASNAGAEHVVVYGAVGAYESIDGGKHWIALRGLDPASGSHFAEFAFFARHALYVVAETSTALCKPGHLVLRYVDPRAAPSNGQFPTRWGTFRNWGVGSSFALAAGDTAAFGLVTFCSPTNGAVPPPKLLTFRAS